MASSCILSIGNGLLLSLIIVHVCYAGQICASCSAVDSGEPCEHHVSCSDDEACRHQLGPIIGKRSEGHHFKCMACCNETSLCNLHLNCDDTNTGGSLPLDCSDLSHPSRRSGVYTIYPYGVQTLPISVLCQFDMSNNGWTVIQRRFDGSVNFYRNWASYKNGFGSSSGEYWIGNDILHQMTSHVNMELKIVMSDFQNVTKYADYSTFHVTDETSGYRLTVGGYSGTAGDSMAYESGMKFTTLDKGNDLSGNNCAQIYKGGWWHNACHYSNLNGLYLRGAHSTYADGIEWYTWHGLLIKDNCNDGEKEIKY